MTAVLGLDCVGRSDVGRRPNNEDAWFASTRLAAVADGVGGEAAGEVASRAVIDAVMHLDKCRLQAPLDRALADAVRHGNEAIGFIADCRPAMAGMSTTLTAVALGADGQYVVANVGDSRTYLLRDGQLTQLTRDESLVQELLDSGAISAEEARSHPQRSLVMRALDGAPDRTPAVSIGRAQVGDRLLLCSDGLSDVVEDDAIGDALAGGSRRACADRLIALALGAGARDNVSVVVADVVALDDPEASWRR
jgi:serine/threonine protein phosphatase PrpC